MAGPYLAKGMVLKKGASSIAGVTNITPPNLTRDALETTTHGQADDYRTFEPGLLDPGELTIEVLYDPAVHTFLAESEAAATAYTIAFSSSPTVSWTFQAFVTSFQPTGDLDGLSTGAVTFKLTGAVTQA